MLFSEPKISQFRCSAQFDAKSHVSVLFSEPKISQSPTELKPLDTQTSFSALQRAENFSIGSSSGPLVVELRTFQCSSASRKFLNIVRISCKRVRVVVSVLFSEPKISQSEVCLFVRRITELFQCSSASRKFLNLEVCLFVRRITELFQCSSASRKFLNTLAVCAAPGYLTVSVLFSEPKISQSSLYL